ncbi:ATPase P [Anaerocolumna cellulosilytica]|uniref:ATPase P n=1 Tax=Anaerocolumna cellulosilytica TaxID=433286 RepID=A0A6S6QX88_9FIRM|nr:cation-translocating P-type ATPase [Anaerocolumna cellulosilytica]MBB5196772.1 cation-transporting ATPase E [Anaerocolumna cellulosilytica]BCJ95833.1 ATPase P [Anaerocolumna cellulosilytica]
MRDTTNDIKNIIFNGLTEEEVEERVKQGLVNHTNITTGKSVKEIILSNILTYFNLIFFIIALLLIYVGSYRNLTFLPVIIGNTIIGIVQELRAKQILDKMNILNAPHSIVIRNGVQKQIVSEQLVKDDIVLLAAGNQICADAFVVQGNVQVNEALLTGEADEIEKVRGNKLLSGSFVVSGQCFAKLENVGKHSYISKLTAEAKTVGSDEQSEMICSINLLVKWIGIGIIPIGVLLFYQGYYLNGETIQKSIVSMVAALIGMIPEGLYLLTTIALALSTMRLAKRHVLLHDMKSIEALARVDVLCVDKTGTITEARMQVEEVLPSQTINGIIIPKEELEQLLVDYSFAIQDDNATIHAIKEYTNTLCENIERRKPLDSSPFSSTTKYSSVTFEDGTFVLGAPEFVMREDYNLIVPEIIAFVKKGHRVLILGKYEGSNVKDGLKEKVVPLAYVILTNPLRKNAQETFSYFKKQGVTVKVISGDNPETVSEVAKCAGIENADNFIDASILDTESKLASALEKYAVFGRVTPKQKQKLVQTLQKAGHTVAMTGDGVNDILAMKDADCSVAMASGSEATAQAAQVVLLDSDFAHMPDVVLEGRQVVNNVQRSAVLFLVKNIFSLLLAVFSVVFTFTYPLEPSQISLISIFTIGIPGFMLALEPNKNRIEGHFLKNVMIKALPAGLTDVLAVGSLVVCGEAFLLSKNDIATASTMLLAVVGFIILIKISSPLNKIKYSIVILNIFGLAFCGIFLHRLFAISEMSKICVLLLIIFAFSAESLFRYLSISIEKINDLYLRLKKKKNHIHKG